MFTIDFFFCKKSKNHAEPRAESIRSHCVGQVKAGRYKYALVHYFRDNGKLKRTAIEWSNYRETLEKKIIALTGSGKYEKRYLKILKSKVVIVRAY